MNPPSAKTQLPVAKVSKDGNFQMIIKKMVQSDVKALIHTFATPLTWWGTRRQYQRYWQEQQANQRVMLIAWRENQIVGYVNVLFPAQYLGFQKAEIPEINDLVVPTKYQKQGIGTALMDEAEQLAKEQGHSSVGLGCGDTAYYSAAQRLYKKRGYAPDDSGPQKTPWGLMTYMTKNLGDS